MKTRMRLLSAILATIMVFSSTGMTTFAESVNGTTVEEITVEETTEEAVVETSEEMTTIAETDEESVVEETTIDEEEITEEVTTVEETVEEVSTTEEITVEETTEETTIVEETSEEVETEPETTVETEEVKFSGLSSNDVLSVAEKTAKAELREYQGDILAMTEGVDYVSGEIMVAADSQEKAEQYAEAFDGTLIKYSEGPGYVLIELSKEVTVVDAVVASASAEINLPAAWPNYIWSIAEEDAEDEMSSKGVSKYNDEYLGDQWFHEYIGSEWAWLYGYTGAGVSVGIVDTGILKNHEDLSANTLTGEYWATDTASEQGIAWTDDKGGHGTHVAGLVAADGKNGVGGSGVAPDATLKGYAVLDENGSGTSDWVYDGFYAALEDGHDIINMSLGGGGYDSLFQDLCDEAYTDGIFVVAAAGNESTSATTYPACYEHVCAIGALEASGAAAGFSNFGSWVDLAFPGVDILSTYIDEEGTGATDIYEFMPGTSMASPIAAGVAAVLLSADLPELEGKTGGARVDALEEVMKSAVKKSSSAGMGKGTTSLAKALNISDEVTTPEAPVFSQKAGTYKQETLEVEISSERGYTTIYYSTNGKNPVYKNGQITNGQEYTGPITLASAKATLKAIVVNASGRSSKVTTAKYVLKPAQVREIGLFVKSGTTTIAKGKSVTFGTNLTPVYATDKAVTWTVEPANQGVKVKNGKVTASKNAMPGEYTVSAQMKNYSITPAVCTVTVTEASVKSVVFAQKKATLIRTINVPNPTLDLAEGLKVTYTGGEAGTVSDVTWSSSNPAVASVNESGIVTAVNNGTATITALAKDGSGKKASCKVTVKNNAVSISLSGLTEVAKGKSITLKADVQPAKAINSSLTWTVEPAGKGVTVKKGKVTASKNADSSVIYKITATTKDNTVTSEAFSVKIVDGAISKIKLPKTATIFTTEGNYGAATTLQLAPQITGGEGCDTSLVEYSSSVPSVATVDPKTGLVKAKAVGKTVITCKALDGSNKSAKITVNVNIPMARMTIAPTKGLSGYIAKGKKVKFTILAGSDFGAPTSTKVRWVVEDPSIVSVDKNGNVKGKKLGSTNIAAIAADGSNVYATYSVKVVKAPSYYGVVFLPDSYYANVGTVYIVSDAGILEEPYATPCKIDVTGPKVNGTVGCQISQPYTNVIDVWFDPEGRGTYTIKVTLLDGSNKTKTVKVRY